MRYVCDVGDVPIGEGRKVSIDGHEVAVFRTTTGWYALDNACPHAGGPLADGITADRSVICPLHERRFALDTGEAMGHACGGVRTHRLELRGDGVYLEVAAVQALAA